MTRQQPGPGGPGQDPVEEFFATHRAQVRDEPADDLTWRRIRDGHHRDRSRRRGAWTGALVAAAAALAIVVGPSLLPTTEAPDVAGPPSSATGPEDGPSDGPARTPEAPTTAPGDPSAAPTQTPTGESAPDPAVATTGVPEGGLPPAGRFTDVTTASPQPTTDTGVRYAVVMHPCDSNGWCSVLALSEDGGTTWEARADLDELGMVHRVQFVDHGRGWVWGDKAPLWTTTDGGRTWTQVEIAADYVADLSVQGDVLMATTLAYRPCAEGACLPEGSVVLTDPTDRDWVDDVRQDLGPVEQTSILDAGEWRFVASVGSTQETVLLRLQEDGLESTATPLGCGSGPVAVTDSGPGAGPGVGWDAGLYALCDDERGLSLQVSPNGGRTWEPTNTTVPSFVLGEEPPLLASTGPGHLLLVGEGNHAVTTDGGQTWSAEAFLPGADARPERVEIVSGQLIAYPTQGQASGDLAYWRSGDGGLTWETVDYPG